MKAPDPTAWTAMAARVLAVIGLGLGACSETDQAADTSEIVNVPDTSDTADASSEDTSGDTEPSGDTDTAGDTSGGDASSDSHDGDTTIDTDDSHDAPPPEELVFVRIEGDAQGVLGGWNNPWAELGGISLDGYGWVEAIAWGVDRPTNPSSGLPSGLRRYSAVALWVPLSDGVLRTLATTTVADELGVEFLWFELQPDGGYSRRRVQTLMSATTDGVEVETRRGSGSLSTWAKLSFGYTGIGITDYGTNTSFLEDEATTF